MTGDGGRTSRGVRVTRGALAGVRVTAVAVVAVGAGVTSAA